ncbi:MAG: hypothetical protein K0U93_30830 [Gammaproteobacteria bacterium]|nr:hypothetical protein [Gammaproteobacteria bacterium]
MLKGNLCAAIGVAGLLLPFLATAAGDPKVPGRNLDANQTKSQAHRATEANQSLPFTSENRSLADVVADLTELTGVGFVVSPGIADTTITTSIDGDDWNVALRQFLMGFNHLAIVDGAGKLRRVWITGIETDRPTNADLEAMKVARDRAKGLAEEPGGEAFDLPVALWEPGEGSVKTRDGLAAAKIEVDPSVFESLEVGQPLELMIPQEGAPLYAVVDETHDQLNGDVQVWSGPVDGSHETASFTISRGSATTYVTVATGTSVYEISINNETGAGTVVDEIDMTKGKDGNDIVIPPEAESSVTQ